MRKPYRQELIRQFTVLVKNIDPSFEPFEGKSLHLFPSHFVLVSRRSESVWLLLEVFINPNGLQSFTILFGWSTKGRFPEVLDIKFLDTEAKRERFREKEYRQRIGVFLGQDKWWFFEGESGETDLLPRTMSRAEADAVVSGALKEVEPIIRNQVMPYLWDFCAENGELPKIH